MNNLSLNTAIFLSRLSAWFTEKNHLHTSRFSYPHELLSLMGSVFDPTSLLIGVGPYNTVLQVTQTPQRPQLRNLLVVARTGGGKGLLAIPQILSWKHSLIINDIKGELSEKTAGYRATLGDVFFIDPKGVGHHYDPTQGKHTDLELKAIAKSLLYKTNEGEGEIFTQRATRMLFALLKAARLEDISPLVYLAKRINEPLPYIAERVNRVSPALAVTLLDSTYEDVDFQDKFLLSAWGTLTARLDSLLAESVVRSLATSDFTMQDVMCADKPITIYLRWSEEDLLVLSPLIKLLWGSFINGLTTTYDNLKGKHCHPVLLLLDEAASTAVSNLPEYAATVCGRGVSFWIAVQDLSQLDGIYGRQRARSLRNNCDTQIYYRPNDLETAEYIEKRLGRKSDYAQSKTSREGKETTQGQSEQGVPLLTARNIMELKDEEIIGFYSNLKPFRATRIDWRNDQMLVKRTQLPMPPLPVLPPMTPPELSLQNDSEKIVEKTYNEKILLHENDGFLKTLTNPDRRLFDIWEERRVRE